MTPDQFVFWLKGYFEISQHSNVENSLNEKQVQEIKNHLDLVLTKVTPVIALEDQMVNPSKQNRGGEQLPLFPNYVPNEVVYPKITCNEPIRLC